MSFDEIESVILESDVSDHFSTLTKISGIYSQTKEEDIYYRNSNLSSEQWKRFNSDLMYKLACNLPRSPDEIDVNAYARDLTDIYKSVIDEYMPLKKKNSWKKNLG